MGVRLKYIRVGIIQRSRRTDMADTYSNAEDDMQLLNAAIVGGGKGCVSIMQMVEEGTLQDFPMRILGVADINSGNLAGNPEKALSYFEELIAKYPDSEYVAKARQWIERIR